MAFVPQLELVVGKHFSDNWALSIFVCMVAIFDFKRRGKMGRVVNAINEVCISLSRPIPYSLNLVPRALFPTSTSKAREKRPGNEVAAPLDSSIKPFERENIWV